jgi:hypothetical protein
LIALSRREKTPDPFALVVAEQTMAGTRVDELTRRNRG